MSPESWEKVFIALGSILVTAIVSEIVHRLRSRSTVLTTIADRYIAETSTTTAQDTPAFRLGAMQRAGVAMLSHRQLKTFVAEVTGRGCTNPFKDSDIEKFVPANKFPAFLRACSERGIPLSDDTAIYRALLRLIEEGETAKAKKTGKKS